MQINRYLPLILLGILFLWNVYVFLLYAVDKHKARRERWRIPESAMLTTAFLCGGIGALIAMQLVHHKTRNRKFRILVPMAFVLTIAVVLYLLWRALILLL